MVQYHHNTCLLDVCFSTQIWVFSSLKMSHPLRPYVNIIPCFWLLILWFFRHWGKQSRCCCCCKRSCHFDDVKGEGAQWDWEQGGKCDWWKKKGRARAGTEGAFREVFLLAMCVCHHWAAVIDIGLFGLIRSYMLFDEFSFYEMPFFVT